MLEQLDKPALFVTGKLDRLIPWEETKRAADAAPRGEFVLFEDGNHVCANVPYKARPAGGRLAAGAARLRVALVGAGMWAPRLAAAAARARRASSSSRRVEDADGVLIATPNHVHAENAIAAAAAGRHVFVEKPIADTVEAAERIRDACVEAGVVLMVGHAFRRLGAARRAKELVGELGTVVLAEACFSLPGKLPPTAWRAQRARNPGGPLMQLGIHHVDTLAYLLGPIARTTGRFAHVHTEAEIDDVGVATLEFASGALGVLTGSYVSPHVFSLRLQGSDGVLDYRADLARSGRRPSGSTR